MREITTASVNVLYLLVNKKFSLLKGNSQFNTTIEKMIFIKHLFIITSIILLFTKSGVGQLNNLMFENHSTIKTDDKGKLFLGMSNLFFLKNNEYFNTIIDGYTLFGYQFNPFLSYHIHKNIRINTGWYFQKDFGNTDVTTSVPIISMEWKKNQYSVIFGNLESSLGHRLIEPLYDFEFVLNKRIETGIQIKINREKLFTDFWIDWQYMQYWRDKNQERFIGGLSIQKQLIKIGNSKIDFPFQIVAQHKGGQLDINVLPAQTLVNIATGIKWTHKLKGKLKSVEFDGYYVIDKDITKVRTYPTGGNGLYFNSMVTTTFGLEAMVSYWKAQDYTAFTGGRRYQSISVFDPTRIETSPHLLIFRFLYNYQFAENISFTARVEPFLDLTNSTFQYSYAIYISYRDLFFLTKRKSK